MSWKELTEEGRVFWISEEHGNIFKTPDGKYVAMVPIVHKLGPFFTLEEAKNSCLKKNDIVNLTEELNLNLIKNEK